jgi:hypothetical protein
VLPETGFASEVVGAVSVASSSVASEVVASASVDELPADPVRVAWLDALAEMETVAARSGDGEYAPDVWNSAAMTAAADLGPLPVDLQERALDLAATQKSAIARVVEARRTVMAHLAALRSVPAVRDAEQSVYLDVNG